ncbi:hypothetical protein HDU76_009441 [Blyttiomyces sp. JEL0837]|nr:hypothetical protein HDU76_009441 [Blyttiomyces sp. JEL0837]
MVANTVSRMKDKYGLDKLRELRKSWGIVPIRESKQLSSNEQTALENAIEKVGLAPDMEGENDNELYWQRVLEVAEIKGVEWNDIRLFWHKRMAGIGAMVFESEKEEKRFIRKMLYFMRGNDGVVDIEDFRLACFKELPLRVIAATVRKIKVKHGLKDWSNKENRKMLQLAKEIKTANGEPDLVEIARSFPGRPNEGVLRRLQVLLKPAKLIGQA